MNHLRKAAISLGAAAILPTLSALAQNGTAALLPPPDRETAQSTAITPYKIHVPESVLKDLKARIARTRWPDEIGGAGWDYGANEAYMRQLLAYWRDKFDWRKQERRLNSFDQFMTTVDGVRIHFIHERSRNPKALPLVITHGWPNSNMDMYKVIRPLTDPAAFGGDPRDSFDVISVSLPGFGFSDRPSKPGYGYEQMADMLQKLMARLGYTRYAVQGSDWGATIGRRLAIIDRDHVVGLHLSRCNAGPPPGPNPEEGIDPAELARARARQDFMSNERGYAQIQGTKPQTIGYALNDSPVGLAAWIVEKWRIWSDNQGDVESVFTKDEILTNITIYWVTQTATSAGRIYFEPDGVARSKASFTAGRTNTPIPAGGSLPAPGAAPAGGGGPGGQADYAAVPTACLIFAQDVSAPPRKWFAYWNNLTHWSEYPHGGHYPMLEEPQALVDDVRLFFRDLR